MRASLYRWGGWTIVGALLVGGVLVLLRPPRQARVVARGVDSPAVVRAEGVRPPPATGRAAPGVASVETAREAARPEAFARPRSEGSISGVVLGPAGEPLEGAKCSLSRGRAPLGLDSVLADPEDEGSVVAAGASTLSDSTGRFELPAPPGYWRLRIEASGTRSFEEDHLKAGDFRWVRLEPEAQLLVHVVTGSQAPLRGARVELVADEYSPAHLAVASAATDAGGRAMLAVPSGRWTLAVRHSEHRSHFEPLDFPAGSAHLERTVVLSPGFRVFGKVSVRGIAAPPSGTLVAIESMLMFRESVVVACDPDGSFDTGRVLSSEQVLDVAALAPGFGETRKELDLGERPPDGEVEVHLSLERRDRAVHGRVVDAHGTPVERASVFVKPLLALPADTEIPLPADVERLREVDVARGPKESYQAQWRRVTRTDSRGEFRVDGLDPRRPYALLVVSPHHANARAWIEATDSAEELDLGTIVLPAGGRIHGVVRARDGSSAGGLQVSTIRLERVALRAGTSLRSRRPGALTEGFQTVANLAGEFALGPLPEGEYFLLVAGVQFGPFVVLAGEERGPEVLEIGGDPRAEEESEGLSGRVVDDRARPVAGCLVQLFREGERGALELVAATTVDTEGAFQLAARPPGPFLFRALDIEDQFQQHGFRFDGVEEWRSGDIVLLPNPERGAAIGGRVLGPSGEGLASIRVTLHVSPVVTGCSCVTRTATTDRAGGFHFGPIVRGAHRIVVVDPEGRFRPREQFPVQPGDPLELVLEE